MKKWCAIILFSVLGLLALAQGLRDPAFIASLHYVESAEEPETPWSPTNVAGLQLWFRTESLAELGQSEGSVVSNWISGLTSFPTRYATNSDGTKSPTLTNTFNGLSGTNALYFDGTDDWLYVSNALGIARAISNATMIVVVDADNNAGDKCPFMIGNNATSAREFIGFNSAEQLGAGGRTADGDSTQAFYSSEDDVNFPICVCVNFKNSISSLFIYTNNVLCLETNAWQDAENTSDTDSSKLQIGGIGTAYDFIGCLAEVIYYVPAISDEDRTNCWLYLSNKYALP